MKTNKQYIHYFEFTFCVNSDNPGDTSEDYNKLLEEAVTRLKQKVATDEIELRRILTEDYLDD